MKKYIILSAIVFIFAFSFLGNVYAKTNLTSDEVQAVVEILKVLKVNDKDISRIKNILDESNIQEVRYSPKTGKEIMPVKIQETKETGCEDNAKYNRKNGKSCPDYKTPVNQNKGSGFMSAQA